MEIHGVIQDMHILKVMQFCRRVCVWVSVSVWCVCANVGIYIAVYKYRSECNFLWLILSLHHWVQGWTLFLRSFVRWCFYTLKHPSGPGFSSGNLFSTTGFKAENKSFFVLYFFQLKIIFDAVNKFSLGGFYSFLSKVWDCFYYQYPPLLSEVDFMLSSIEIKQCHCEECDKWA